MKELKGWLERAYNGGQSHEKLKYAIYDDPFLGAKQTWLRQCEFTDTNGQTLKHMKCWICTHFCPKGLRSSNSKFGKDGIAIGGCQGPRTIAEHLKNYDKQDGDHYAAEQNYLRRAQAYKEAYWGEAAQPEAPGSIVLQMEEIRKNMDEKLMNHTHLVYTCIRMKESINEFITHINVSKLHRGNYYGDLCPDTK